MQLNVHEAKTQLSRLLELVEEGETVIIARHGEPRRRTHPGPPPGRLSVRHRRAGTAGGPRRRLVAANEQSRSRRLDRRAVKILTDTHTLVWALSDPRPGWGRAG